MCFLPMFVSELLYKCSLLNTSEVLYVYIHVFFVYYVQFFFMYTIHGQVLLNVNKVLLIYRILILVGSLHL